MNFAQIAKPKDPPEPAFNCCPNMKAVWGPPTIDGDWLRYISVCNCCGFSGHVVESAARPGTETHKNWVRLLGGLGL